MTKSHSRPAHRARKSTTRETLKPIDIAFVAGVAIIAGVFLELFFEAEGTFYYGSEISLLSLHASPFQIARMVGLTLVIAALFIIARRFKNLADWAFGKRYLIAAIAAVALIALQISGSSIALWDAILNGSANTDLRGVLFGMPRPIRSDEYMVFTPMAFSQYHTGYAAISELARSVPTDVSMVYAQPCWTIATLFRPFLWGYLVLGSAYGLSFFWCGRLIALFMVSFEFGRFITRDNRGMAFAYALLITFAPITQWWFAVNGTAELFIFSQGGILAFRAFLRAPNRARRLALAALSAYAAGCFVMVIYPAWQVCIAYVIAAICIADIIACRQENVGALARGIGWKRAFVSYWLPLIIALLAVGALIALSLLSSTETIQAVRNSIYPGHRSETGGGLLPLLFDWADSWLFAITPENTTPNPCERASMYSLFPLGIVLAAFALKRQRNPYLIALLIAEAVMLIYGIVGFPAWLAKITLLSSVTSQRLLLALGLSDTILLMASVTIIHNTAKPKHAALPTPAPYVAAVAFGLLAAIAAWFLHPSFAFKLYLVLCAGLAALAAFAFVSALSDKSKTWRIAGIACVIAIAGFCINPVQHGVASLSDNELMREASSLSADDQESIWAGDDNKAAQALLASGMKTINSVATYPDLQTWQKVDPEGRFEDAYNRYAHIQLDLTDEPTTFETPTADSFKAHLNVNDVPKLGIDYWVSQNDLAAYSNEAVSFTPEYSNGIWTIYRVSY